jgi:hypothetical protein
MVTYPERRHYRPKLKEIQAGIEGRHGPDAAAKAALAWE